MRILRRYQSKLCRTLTSELRQDRQTTEKLAVQVKHQDIKIDVAAKVMDRMETTIKDLTQRIENLELNNAKRAVVVTGLYIFGRKFEKLQQIYRFFEEKIGVTDITIEEFFTLGLIEPAPIVVYFQSMREKRDIMNSKSYLKGQVNEDRKPYFINEYYPAAVQEKKRRERDIINHNQQSENENKLETEYVRGKLQVQGETYRKKVETPQPSQLIQLTPEELDEILRLPISRSHDLNKNKSIFTPYAAKVSSHSQIRRLYAKLKLVQPDARHIVCAYRMEGGPEHYSNDYCDDEEPGAGRASWK